MKITITKPHFYVQKGMRDTQEDSVCPLNPTEATPFFAVCDGVGGCEGGEMASSLVCKAICSVMSGRTAQSEAMSCRLFEKALREAYLVLLRNRHRSSDMATTLAFMSVNSDGCLVAHLGDSRVYQIRQGKGIIFRTEDHSLVNELLRSHRITEHEARNHPQRNVITRCVCVLRKGERVMQATVNEIHDICRGDVFLLCSDGVYDKVGEDAIVDILSSDLPLERKSAMLAEMSSGSHDNNSAYIVQIADVESGDGVMSHAASNRCYETSVCIDTESVYGIWNRIKKLFW